MTNSTPPSIKPYLIRAWHEWCTDLGNTPYISVFVDAWVDVPQEFVKDQHIILNVGYEATDQLRIDNHMLNFQARFSGQVREIWVPVSHVLAIFSRETQEGMEFTPPNEEDFARLEQQAHEKLTAPKTSDAAISAIETTLKAKKSAPPRKSSLRIVK